MNRYEKLLVSLRSKGIHSTRYRYLVTIMALPYILVTMFGRQITSIKVNGKLTTVTEDLLDLKETLMSLRLLHDDQHWKKYEDAVVVNDPYSVGDKVTFYETPETMPVIEEGIIIGLSKELDGNVRYQIEYTPKTASRYKGTTTELYIDEYIRDKNVPQKTILKRHEEIRLTTIKPLVLNN